MATLQERIEKERAAADAVAAKLTANDAEIKLRAELDALTEKREADERALRDLDLAQREEAAQEALGPKAKIGTVTIQGYPDTFVLVHDPNAFKQFDTTLNSGKKYDPVEVKRRFAMATIYDWNGITDWTAMVRNEAGGETPAGDALRAYLTTYSAMLTPLTNEAGRLAGLYKEERKSRG